jgi:hypothetical protein
MSTSKLGLVPVDLPQKQDPIDGGVQRPMSQQDAADCHGYEMHPQKFVRLVGCHESNAGRHEAGHRPH